MQYFGSNIVEGVAESCVEAEMNWVEVVDLDGAGWRWVHGLVIPIVFCSVSSYYLLYYAYILDFQLWLLFIILLG